MNRNDNILNIYGTLVVEHIVTTQRHPFFEEEPNEPDTLKFPTTSVKMKV